MEKFNKKPYIIGSIVFVLMFGILCLFRKYIKKIMLIIPNPCNQRLKET